MLNCQLFLNPPLSSPPKSKLFSLNIITEALWYPCTLPLWVWTFFFFSLVFLYPCALLQTTCKLKHLAREWLHFCTNLKCSASSCQGKALVLQRIYLGETACRVCTCVCMYAGIFVPCVCAYVCECALMHVCMHVSVCALCMCVCVGTPMCMCWGHKEKRREEKEQ